MIIFIYIYIDITYTSVIYQYLGQSSAGSLCANDCHFDAQMAAALLFLIGYFITLLNQLTNLRILCHILFTSLRDGNRPHRIVGQPLVTANDVGH